MLESVYQSRSKIDAAFYIGRGKVLEIAQLRQKLRANVVIFDDELSGSQVRNLEAAIGALSLIHILSQVLFLIIHYH